MLRSDLCDYSDAYIVVKGTITLDGTANANKRNKSTAFKNNAPFISCISKINNTVIDNAEDLDVLMLMYNLLEYGKNYRKTTKILWNYYRDEPSDPLSVDSESFEYKTSITGNTCNVSLTIIRDGENRVPNPDYDANKEGENKTPKYLSNFWRSSETSLINCEVELILTWSKNCALADVEADADANPAIVAPTGLELQITDTKLYVPVVTLSTKDDNNFLEQLKSGFKRTIKWNEYRSEMNNHTKTNHLSYLIDPTSTKVNRLFALSFENEEDRTYFSKYYVPNVEIKRFNVLIDGKSFFDVPVENKEEAYEKIMSISKNNDYTTGNLLDYEYFSKHYKLIAIDLSKQIELENLDLRQQINFIGKLEGGKATMFFVIEKSGETTFEILQNSVSII